MLNTVTTLPLVTAMMFPLLVVAAHISATMSAVTVTEGNSATLSCTASGDPFPTLSWLRNGVVIEPGTTGYQFLSSGQTLVIGSVVESTHEGQYMCRATNFLGTATATISLSVLGKNSTRMRWLNFIGLCYCYNTKLMWGQLQALL